MADHDPATDDVPTPARLDDMFAKVTAPWTPHVIAELNGQQVKVVKLSGEFIWHHHDNEDELFLVHRGRLRMEFRERSVTLDPGQFIVVPRGVEHRPVAEEEVEVILFEPATTLNTGNIVNDRTVTDLVRL